VHDLRVAFVTVALANGKSEAWVTDRTGHKTSDMVAKYRRKARSVAEMQLGAFQPLYLAVPELAAFGLAPTWAQPTSNGRNVRGHAARNARSQRVATNPARFKISGPEGCPGSTPGGATKGNHGGSGDDAAVTGEGAWASRRSVYRPNFAFR
jgi:hypothetical protein